MSIEAINFLSSPVTNMKPVEPSLSVDFSSLIGSGLEQVNSSLKSAEIMLQDLALDKPVATHEVMLVMEKAKLELQLSVEVRNKLLEGYQELMRMQV